MSNLRVHTSQNSELFQQIGDPNALRYFYHGTSLPKEKIRGTLKKVVFSATADRGTAKEFSKRNPGQSKIIYVNPEFVPPGTAVDISWLSYGRIATTTKC